MKNADMPAMPSSWKDFDSMGLEVTRESYHGLNKREMFAMNALQGLLSNSALALDDLSEMQVARFSIEYADALLAELEK